MAKRKRVKLGRVGHGKTGCSVKIRRVNKKATGIKYKFGKVKKMKR